MKQIPVFRKYYKEFLVIKKYWDKASEEEKADAVERCIKEFILDIRKNRSEGEIEITHEDDIHETEEHEVIPVHRIGVYFCEKGENDAGQGLQVQVRT